MESRENFNRNENAQSNSVSKEIKQNLSETENGDDNSTGIKATTATQQIVLPSQITVNGSTSSHPTVAQPTPAVIEDEEENKWERKCVQCWSSKSIPAFFVGLGRFFTGFNLTIVLSDFPKCYPNPAIISSSQVVSIPFENLQEETPPLPSLENQRATIADSSRNDTQSIINIDNTSSPGEKLRVKVRLPIFTVLITISQWTLFHFLMRDEYDGWVSSQFEFNPLKRYEIWRFFTATWIHGSAAHLWGNLRLQLITGCCLEVVHGWKRIAILYFGGVIFANLTTSVAEPFLRAYGASGGVYALLTGHLASNILNWNETWGASNRCLLIFIYLGLSILAAFINQNVGKHVLPSHQIVGHAAHIGGAVGGLLMAFFVLRNFHKRHWEIKAAKICRNIVIVWFILAVGANIGDQIFFEKWKEIDRRKKLQLILQNHTVVIETNHTIVHLP